MARKKQANPQRRDQGEIREVEELYRGGANGNANGNGSVAAAKGDVSKDTISPIEVLKRDLPPVSAGAGSAAAADSEAGLMELVVCVGGIYASFLTWALLQERITTTTYGGPKNPERFNYSVALNTIQSTFAALAGYVYLLISNRHAARRPPIIPSRSMIPSLLLIAITGSLASPFGYAALKHIDYITFILAKSCKLLPVLLLHVSIFRRRYPLYKYVVVVAVTAGVAVFTLHHPSSAKKAKASNVDSNNLWGLFLLGINLLFDGLTNCTQDHIFSTYRPFSGPQMMVAHNLISTLLTSSYLLLSPHLLPLISAALPALALPTSSSAAHPSELHAALSFLHRHPSVTTDVLLFSACGAIGQVFIFYTLAHFSSLLLVTVTVTRKMLTMVLSVFWFGHRIRGMQWLGVGLVFGGVAAEAVVARREKKLKEAAMARAKAKAKGDGKKEL